MAIKTAYELGLNSWGQGIQGEWDVGQVETQTKSRHVTSKIICCNKYLKIQLSETFSSRRGQLAAESKDSAKKCTSSQGAEGMAGYEGCCRSPGASGVGLWVGLACWKILFGLQGRLGGSGILTLIHYNIKMLL